MFTHFYPSKRRGNVVKRFFVIELTKIERIFSAVKSALPPKGHIEQHPYMVIVFGNATALGTFGAKK